MRYAKKLCCFIVEVRNCRTEFPNFWWTVQVVAVDDVRPAVSDGLYSKCTPPPPPHLSVFYSAKKKKKRLLNVPLLICLPMWALFDQTKKRTVSETQRCSVTKPYFYRARELWTDWVHGVSSQLTDTKLQTIECWLSSLAVLVCKVSEKWNMPKSKTEQFMRSGPTL